MWGCIVLHKSPHFDNVEDFKKSMQAEEQSFNLQGWAVSWIQWGGASHMCCWIGQSQTRRVYWGYQICHCVGYTSWGEGLLDDLGWTSTCQVEAAGLKLLVRCLLRLFISSSFFEYSGPPHFPMLVACWCFWYVRWMYKIPVQVTSCIALVGNHETPNFVYS